jgi:hypothetical protein
MDNECSKAVEQHIRSNKMEIQLVPPHNHCIDAAKCAISTFKEHFVAALATVNMLCPLQFWDEFLPQVELTINLLRFSRRNPLISANHKLYGPFDFNKNTSRSAWHKGPGLQRPCHSNLLGTPCY